MTDTIESLRAQLAAMTERAELAERKIAELEALVGDGVDSHPRTDVVGAVKHILKIRDELFAELNAVRDKMRHSAAPPAPTVEATADAPAVFDPSVGCDAAEMARRREVSRERLDRVMTPTPTVDASAETCACGHSRHDYGCAHYRCECLKYNVAPAPTPVSAARTDPFSDARFAFDVYRAQMQRSGGFANMPTWESLQPEVREEWRQAAFKAQRPASSPPPIAPVDAARERVVEAARLYKESVLARREYSDWTEDMQREKPAEFDQIVLRMNLKRARGEAMFTALAALDAAKAGGK